MFENFKIVTLTLLLSVLFITGCVKTPEIMPDYSDITACGDFEVSTGDGGPTSRYFVCRDTNDGKCYYKKTFTQEIQGCDPEYDKNPYGNDECFEDKTELYSFDGLQATDLSSTNLNCQNTTQNFYESKVISK